MLTELLQFCFFYPFSSTVTMFPVSVILKVLRPFNPESEKGEPLSATSRGGPCTSDVMGKEKAANHANPFPSFQHCRQAWARALPHFFSDTKNNHTYVSPKYSIFIKQNKKKNLLVSVSTAVWDKARWCKHQMGSGYFTGMPQNCCTYP